MTINGENMNPYEKNSPQNAAYFVIFIIITNFFITNLFVGAAVCSFNDEKEKI
jgi:hypothetical protein